MVRLLVGDDIAGFVYGVGASMDVDSLIDDGRSMGVVLVEMCARGRRVVVG